METKGEKGSCVGEQGRQFEIAASEQGKALPPEHKGIPGIIKGLAKAGDHE